MAQKLTAKVDAERARTARRAARFERDAGAGQGEPSWRSSSPKKKRLTRGDRRPDHGREREGAGRHGARRRRRLATLITQASSFIAKRPTVVFGHAGFSEIRNGSAAPSSTSPTSRWRRSPASGRREGHPGAAGGRAAGLLPRERRAALPLRATLHPRPPQRARVAYTAATPRRRRTSSRPASSSSCRLQARAARARHAVGDDPGVRRGGQLQPEGRPAYAARRDRQLPEGGAAVIEITATVTGAEEVQQRFEAAAAQCASSCARWCRRSASSCSAR
jgi:hypothetical protein